MGLNVLIVVISYLLGSVPTAYIAARWVRDFDIRQQGSGQVGGSNVWHTVSRRAAIFVGIVDFGKGLVAVLVARLLGASVEGQVLASVAAVAGHNWSVLLRFSGGRGIATMAGALALLAPWGLAVLAVFGLAGLLSKAIPVGMLLGVAALPPATWLLGEPTTVVLGCLSMFLLMMVKRVVPRRKWPSRERRRVLLYRLLFDRDVRSKEAWVKGRHGEVAPSGVASVEQRKTGQGETA
ncbi:MAG: glycerol-3-phosphate acyltransferase [Chloroflexota bacterium]